MKLILDVHHDLVNWCNDGLSHVKIAHSLLELLPGRASLPLRSTTIKRQKEKSVENKESSQVIPFICILCWLLEVHTQLVIKRLSLAVCNSNASPLNDL
jgi:hypothetical protein